MKTTSLIDNETAIRNMLLRWAETTRIDAHDEVLVNHHPDLIIFDVLPPLKYKSAAEYRASWDEWQPQASDASIFEFVELTISAGLDKAYAFGIIQCGGETPDGTPFEDTVRATFCLDLIDSSWKITHQHVSKPVG